MNRSHKARNGSDESAHSDLQTPFFSSDDTRDRGSRPRQSSVGRNRLKGFCIYRIHSSSPLLSPLAPVASSRFRARISLLHQARRVYRYAGTCLCIIHVRTPAFVRACRKLWRAGTRGRERGREREREREREGERERGRYVYFEDYQSLVTCKGSNYPGADWAPFAAPTARLVHPRWWRRLHSPRSPSVSDLTNPSLSLGSPLFRSSYYPFSQKSKADEDRTAAKVETKVRESEGKSWGEWVGRAKLEREESQPRERARI